MEKASPAEMRKALEVVDTLKKGGILFVPVPVMGDKDHQNLISILDYRLEAIIRLTENQQE